MSWTPDQRRAIQADAPEVCVSAGAGSGKTGVLVERFVRLVREEAAGVGHILVITFTEKATKEMKGRIVRALAEAGLHEQRRQVESAYISTIHGFCSRLLKENPFEAGVDPAYEVLEENEAARLVRHAVEEVIEGAFARGDEALIDLVAAAQDERRMGAAGQDPLAFLGTEVQRNLSRVRGAGWRQDQLLAHWSAGAAGTAAVSRSLAAAALAGAVQQMRALGRDLAAAGRAAAASLDAARREVLAGVEALPLVDARTAWDGLSSAAAAVHKLGLRSANGARCRGAGPNDDAVIAVLARIREASERAALLKDADAELEQRAEGLCHAFWGLAAQAWAAYEGAKRERQTLDNEDLQAEAVHLLGTSPGVLRRYRRLFRYVMVDEFQDTNPLQMRLVRLLHPLGEPDPPAPPDERNSLFVVGDAQQSIYAFRDADPSLFRAVEEHCLKAAERAPDAHVTMAANFRARADIIGLVNYLFSQMWATAPQRFMSLEAAAEPASGTPSVELLLSADPTGRQQSIEAAGVARRIRELVTQGEPLIAAPGGGRPARWGDVAVLMRAFTPIEHYERALAAEGVPYYVVGGGRGYYNRNETRDVLNALTVIDSPLDDLALASTLRSPMAGVSLDTLWELSQCARGPHGPRSLYEAIPLLLERGCLPAEEAEAVRRLRDAADRLRAREDRAPVAVLLDELIEATAYDARVLVRPHGARRLANVRKLVQMACAQPGQTLGEFIRRVRQLERISEREGDAPTEEEAANVVRLYTIHKAKGLEFPVVVLAGMSRPGASGRYGAFLCEPRSLALGCTVGGKQTAAYKAAAEGFERVSQEEAERVLYVALTRARDRLVLSGAVSGRARSTNWADTVFRYLGVLSAPPGPEERTCPGGLTVRVAPAEGGSGTAPRTPPA